MIYVHPLFMVVVLGLAVQQAMLGRRIEALIPRSPEFSQRDTLLHQHRARSWLLLGLMALGAIGGIVVTVKFLPGDSDSIEILNRTYGHGYLGLLILSVLVAMAVVGSRIKTIVRDRIRERFLTFHRNMAWVAAGLAVFSVITGIAVLVWVPR